MNKAEGFAEKYEKSILTGIKELTNNTISNEEADTNMWKAIEDLITDGKTEDTFSSEMKKAGY